MSKLYSCLNLDYEIYFDTDIQEILGFYIENNCKYHKIIFITDETVDLLYSKKIILQEKILINM